MASVAVAGEPLRDRGQYGLDDAEVLEFAFEILSPDGHPVFTAAGTGSVAEGYGEGFAQFDFQFIDTSVFDVVLLEQLPGLDDLLVAIADPLELKEELDLHLVLVAAFVLCLKLHKAGELDLHDGPAQAAGIYDDAVQYKLLVALDLAVVDFEYRVLGIMAALEEYLVLLLLAESIAVLFFLPVRIVRPVSCFST